MIRLNFKEYYEALYRRYLQDLGFTYKDEENTMLITTPEGVKIRTRRHTYSFVLDEIFVMKIYGDRNLSGRPVIDIGASIADTALYFASRGGRVYAFEPIVEHYSLGVENININDNLKKNIYIYNEPATAKRINELIASERLKNIFLKIDCEGCEYEVLPGLDLTDVTDVAIEYHGQPEPLEQLLSRDFKVEIINDIIFGSRITKDNQ